jgi:VWFA-related protein
MIRRALWWAGCITGLTLVVLLLAWPAAAQSPDGVVVRIASVDDSAFPTITAVFTADEAGRPIPDLGTDSVRITESGAPARVVRVQTGADSTIPLALVVTFDTSGSMAGANLAQSKAAATALFRSLSSNDIGALITFADDVRVAVPLPGKPPALEAAVGSLQATGNTALYDAVAESGRVAAGSGVQRRAVVLFSDGEDFGGRSQITREQSLQEAASGQALFYVIGIGQQVDRAYLEELASRSGGRYFQAQSAAEVPGIYSTIETLLRSQYVATFEAASAREPQSRSLSIAVTTASGSGSGETTYASRREAPTPTAVPATAVPTAVTAPAAEPVPEEPESSGGGAGILVFLLLSAALVAGVAVFVFFRRRKPLSAPAPDLGRIGPLPRHAPLATSAARGTLTASREGNAVQSLLFDGRPVTIGGASACDLQLPDPQLEGTELRLWWRDGSAMAHVLKDRDVVPLLNGAPFRWASLSDGDELQLGPYAVRYRSEDHQNGQ